jgi:hypothetical protein
MAWFDRVIATPIVGLQFVPDLEVHAKSRQIAAKIMMGLKEQEIDTVASELPKTWGLVIKTEPGITYRIDIEDLVADFSYTIEKELRAGELPKLSVGKPRQYSELLPKCLKAVSDLSNMYMQHSDRGLEPKRIGVVLRASMSPDENHPPGIAKILETFENPWPKGLKKIESLFLTNLTEQTDTVDRCHYTMRLDRTAPSPQLDFVLDWQRLYKEGRVLKSIKDLQPILDDAVKSALIHFEQVGQDGFPN